ncbi:hypothetical protein O6H91_22G052000 [Diphasiastrum complanatum]|uniref:Uncharacterized protein n=1 Tax=Diphasiastrum complanatum TaxID=34168 RepID=A0ACC2AFF3_DIPCM|nr:hypothetical protein O6H91_22G052000 [Diphasiastrum complanatum]
MLGLKHSLTTNRSVPTIIVTKQYGLYGHLQIRLSNLISAFTLAAYYQIDGSSGCVRSADLRSLVKHQTIVYISFLAVKSTSSQSVRAQPARSASETKELAGSCFAKETHFWVVIDKKTPHALERNWWSKRVSWTSANGD